MSKKEVNSLIKTLAECYMLLEELSLNPQKAGYFIMLRKAKAGSKAPIDLNLTKFKIEVEADIRDTIYKIRKRLGWYVDVPGGIKE